MPNRGTESDFESTTIERLESLGYEHVFGFDIDRPHTEVVLRDRLHAALHATSFAVSSAIFARIAVSSGAQGNVTHFTRSP